MAEGRKHVFISHVHEADHRLAPLKDLLNNAGMEVRDGSIHSDKPKECLQNPSSVRVANCLMA